VHPYHLRQYIGSELAQIVLTKAKSFNVQKIFTLTYKPDFFKQFGFVEIERSDLSLKIWGD
jgi:amino-acid N-acetyltransferase